MKVKGLVANQLSYGRWYTRQELTEIGRVSIRTMHGYIQTNLDAGLLRWRLEPRQGQVGRSRILYARMKS